MRMDGSLPIARGEARVITETRVPYGPTNVPNEPTHSVRLLVWKFISLFRCNTGLDFLPEGKNEKELIL